MQRPSIKQKATISTRTVDNRAGSRASLQTLAHPPEAANRLSFYPAYTFKASPTWSKWVKLTCRDIHTVLKPHEKYSNVTTPSSASAQEERTKIRGRNDPPLLLFYLNHPIHFVQVVGIVVVLEEYFEKFSLFTIDDSSGGTIDVTCPKPEEDKTSVTIRPAPNLGSKTTQQASVKAKTNDTSYDQDEETTAEQLLQSTLARVKIGTAVQAKGTLSTFRQTRQLSLLRLNIVPSTTHEMALISSRSQFYSSTLSEPWVLSRDEQRRLFTEAQGDRDEEIELARKRRKREQKKRDREERHRETIAREYEEEEEERKAESEQARKAGEQLQKMRKRSHREELEPEETWITVE